METIEKSDSHVEAEKHGVDPKVGNCLVGAQGKYLQALAEELVKLKAEVASLKKK